MTGMEQSPEIRYDHEREELEGRILTEQARKRHAESISDVEGVRIFEHSVNKLLDLWSDLERAETIKEIEEAA